MPLACAAVLAITVKPSQAKKAGGQARQARAHQPRHAVRQLPPDARREARKQAVADPALAVDQPQGPECVQSTAAARAGESESGHAAAAAAAGSRTHSGRYNSLDLHS